MSKPLFTIITVTYNAASTLPATLQSVKEQTFRDFEMIVKDGCSSDATVALAKEAEIPEMKIVVERDKSIYDAMNQAMDMTSGEYLIFLNAGDSFHSPDTLAQIAEAIKANGMPGVVYGQTDIVDGKRRRLGERHLRAPENLDLSSFKTGMLVCHQAFIALRKITGAYDLTYRYSADYDWCIRVLQHSKKNVYIDSVIIDYLDEGVTTAHRGASLRERFRIMCRYYGVIPTILRHIAFAGRFLRRSRREKQMRQNLQ